MPTLNLLVGRSLLLILKRYPVPYSSSPSSFPKPRYSTVTTSCLIGMEHSQSPFLVALGTGEINAHCEAFLNIKEHLLPTTHNSTVKFLNYRLEDWGEKMLSHPHLDFSSQTPVSYTPFSF